MKRERAVTINYDYLEAFKLSNRITMRLIFHTFD